jgi:diguanylate cyclase (GGDEF)-like protein
MFSLDDNAIKDFICNETSVFALSIIDIKNSEIIYANSAMNNIMLNNTSKKCWEALHGQHKRCSWCKINEILNIENSYIDESVKEFEYEYFNEKTDKWYQVQNRITLLENETKVIVLIAIDITKQKKAQGDLISTHVNLVRQALALEEAQEKLKLLASTDSMTKLYNRRYFDKISSSMLALAKRNRADSTIIMLDIDNFKNINDMYGHKVGDNVIISLAKILQELSRESDIASRWGGEEFVILLPNTSSDGAIVIAEKIRRTVEEFIITLEDDNQLKFTVSVGISQVNNELDKNIEASINRADIALYRAKKDGKNRICTEPE